MYTCRGQCKKKREGNIQKRGIVITKMGEFLERDNIKKEERESLKKREIV